MGLNRRVVTIAGLGLAFFLALGYLLLVPGKHDPDWWKHVGLPEDLKANHRAAGDAPVYDAEGNVFPAHHHPVVPHHDDTHGGAAHSEQRRQEDLSEEAKAKHDAQLPSKLTKDEALRLLRKEEDKRKFGQLLQKPPLVVPPKFQGRGDARFKGASAPFTLENGTHYFADYNVDEVVLEPALPETADKKHRFNYVDAATADPPGIYLSNKPRVLVVPNFMTPEECDGIIHDASSRMHRSGVVPYLSAKDKSTVQDVRTSTQAWLETSTGVAATVANRILRYTGFPPHSNEPMQVLRYEKGQKYESHLDYFDPKMYGVQSSNRAVTVFLYLADVAEGGETTFPRADGKPPTWNFKDCTKGLRVRPHKGTIAIFYDMTPDGRYDPYSLHGGCPVVSGVKWGGTLWLRVNVDSHQKDSNERA